MTKSKVDVILHPVRLRILQALVGKQLTVQQLTQYLPHVPQPTLYRHLKILVEENVLLVVETRQIRGAIEKVYALNDQFETLNNESFIQMEREQQKTVFFTFLAQLMGAFEKYVAQEVYDVFIDGLLFREGLFFLSDEEFRTMITELQAVFQKYMDKTPAPHRRGRSIATIIIPDPSKPHDTETGGTTT